MIFKPHNYQCYCIQRLISDKAVALFFGYGLRLRQNSDYFDGNQ